MPRFKTFVVTLELPDGVHDDDGAAYIRKVIRIWRGHDYEDLMSALDPDTVTVFPVTAKQSRVALKWAVEKAAENKSDDD